MAKMKKRMIQITSLVGAASLLGGFFLQSFENTTDKVQTQADSYVSKSNALIDTNVEQYFNSDVIYRLPETVSENQEISVIVKMDTESIVDAYGDYKGNKSLSEFASSNEAKKIESVVERDRKQLLKKLDKSGVSYKVGEYYDTVLSGFEITLKAKDFEKVDELLSAQASLIVGETYQPAVSEVVTNEVDVYPTGIFDSSSSEYQGDGVVVAVLDTGLDYTHSAFSVSNFTTSKEAFTLDGANGSVSMSEKVSQTAAARFSAGLTGEDVYVNKKVPFAYDYADKDPDVLPINSAHGTHVAGIIAGKDNEITGVAPNAQLAIMKVFSDAQEGAKTSWILAGVEDCVVLGVDVINMSLGSTCGFSREVDEERINVIYDSVRDAGISLICAASNSYNATMGSEKNGNNPLTSNPDSGTVGSPSTYAAALSVASVDGVKTPYLTYKDEIIYFNEASTTDAEQKKDFVGEMLKTVGSPESHDFTYVTIPGIGRSSDYPEDKEFYAGKIVLVKRGTTTFEEKVRIAMKEKGAAGIIIYNNVSGTISMSVGDDVGAVCSISQDDGELLAAAGTGTLHISKANTAGPFMSDFSSWGPTSDLKIKPEITAHGGEIYSAIPGQDYDRLSGTSMASPNQAGAAALIRQYVKYSGVFGSDLTTNQITAIVNQLMMSTTDIIYNKNGLPYAVRKQGAGLININKATTTEGYIATFDEDGVEMDKTKLELGDDKDKTGVYEMSFAIRNITNRAVSYDVGSILLTEGVSKIYTSHGDTTSTQDGYLLDNSNTTIVSVVGGENTGNRVTVAASGEAKVTVKVVLSDADKKYMDDSFEYGMYVEGFITLKAVSGATVNMNVPLLAFYGDWTEAPIFDEEYYDTHKDEINKGLDVEDKLMADAYATKAIGKIYSDYISYLGAYYFQQDPSATQIAASKEHIAISNQEAQDEKDNFTICGIHSVWAGLLRNVKELTISITEDATGKEIFNKTSYNQRKSYSSGNTIYSSSIEVDFETLEHNLKNNTQYTVKVITYIDYGEKSEQNNARNVFEFPLYIDFEAPVITDVTYRTEYDKSTKKTKLFADLSVYDNHYAQALSIGQVVPETDPETEYIFSLEAFGKYLTPIYSSFNSTSKVTVELTDYVSKLKNSVSSKYDEDGELTIDYNNNSFIASCYDYAMNSATYEIRLPDEILAMYFSEEEITLSPNEKLEISDILKVYPGESWIQTLDFETSDKSVVDVVNQTILAKASGTAVVKAIGYDTDGNRIMTSVNVKVLAPTDEGYVKYDPLSVNKFEVTGYETKKAYYSVSNDEREIGETGDVRDFDGEFKLTMFPSESVTLEYTLDSYVPDETEVVFEVGNSKIATVSADGTIVAQAEGTTRVNVLVKVNGKKTGDTVRINIEVKDPFTTNAIYLMSYKGLGGEVIIPDDRGLTTIYAYAFSNYEYVDKDVNAGDVIDDEDPYLIKPFYIGENTITKVVIPEGVTTINEYAFAKLTALEEVVLPKSLTTIGVGAFLGCEKLKKINLENAKFINEKAFYGCALEEIDLSSVVAIGNNTFERCKLGYVELPETSQSLGKGAFANNPYLSSVVFEASKIKIGPEVFKGCAQLSSIDVNAAVIASRAFFGCENLSQVTLGKDVAVIGEYAFAGTKVAKFTLDNNQTFTAKAGGALIYKGTELVLAAPEYAGVANEVTLGSDTTSIATGAFSGNVKIFGVVANSVTKVGAYAFADCSNLETVSFDNVEEIDTHAFAGTAIKALPKLDKVERIGDYAFSNTGVTSVSIADGAIVGDYAFAENTKLETVTIGDDVVLGKSAFYCPVRMYTYEATGDLETYYTPYTYEVKDEQGNVIETYSYRRYNYADGVLSRIKTVTIGDNVVIGESAFFGHAKMTTLTLGEGTVIGDYAFMNAAGLTEVDLSKVKSVGASAFSGSTTQDYCKEDNKWFYAYEREYVNGEVVITGYAYSNFAPQIATIDLSAATSLGDGAFAYNSALQTLTIGENLNAVSGYAFADCEGIATIDLKNVTSVGSYAFYGTSLQQLNLSKVENVGESAFALTSLESLTLKEGTVIGDSAFAYCDGLATVEKLDKATKIGANAFKGTALTSATLTEVIELGDFAFAESKITKVALGDKLETIGENPFAGCEIATYGKQENEMFNGALIGTKLNENYAISETVQVIGGVLYSKVPNGLTLVSYPIGKTDDSFVVEEGTVRIAAQAFRNAALRNVTLATTLKAIGDKAFYECDKLFMVVFTSYDAPVLEEEYDTAYISLENLPLSGMYDVYEGLGISKYYMWNVTSNFNNFYFGANFVDYIGHTDGALVMVKPANGQNYNTFILEQYFSSVVEGSNAATENTLAVMALIAALPDVIALSDEAQIVAARAAYDKMSSLEQKALVANYSKLTAAESTLLYLKLREEGGGDSQEPVAPPVAEQTPAYVGYIMLAVGVVMLGGLGFALVAGKNKGE
ncbi:MAG: leucine-rich repeat protein [Clostridia bacterium]|nr:leucine-rich repeat protein [Clostridia bacterium]